MADSREQRSPIDTLKAWFAHRRAGESEAAIRCWAPDAVWRIAGSSTRAGNYSPPDYMALLAEWYQSYPDYVVEFSGPTQTGELVHFTVRSRNGEAPGESEGVLVYRVVEGLITEGWSIPANHGGRLAF